MALGGVANKSCFLDTITRCFHSQRFDLSTALDTQLILYDPLRNWIIRRIDIVYVTENPAAASTIDIGTVADTDAIVDGYSTAASGTKGDESGALTLASTLASTKNDRSSGFPVLTAGTPMVFSNTASGGAGEIVVVVTAFPEDTTSLT